MFYLEILSFFFLVVKKGSQPVAFAPFAEEVCGTFAKCLCFCCSLPVWLFIVIDLAMQPEMPSDLVVPSIRGTEVILDSLITCVILLLGRQLALWPECTQRCGWGTGG